MIPLPLRAVEKHVVSVKLFLQLAVGSRLLFSMQLATANIPRPYIKAKFKSQEHPVKE